MRRIQGNYNVRHLPCVGDISLRISDSVARGCGYSRSPIPQPYDISLLCTLDHTGPEHPFPHWSTALIAKVEREEQRATGRRSCIGTTGDILDPAAVEFIALPVSNSNQSKRQTVEEPRKRKTNHRLEEAEDKPPDNRRV